MLFHIKRGIETLKIPDMIHMEKITYSKKIKLEEDIFSKEYDLSWEELKDKYGEVLDKRMANKLKAVHKKYDKPVYFYFNEDYHNKEQLGNINKTTYGLVVSYDLYQYARYSYQDKLIEYDYWIRKEKENSLLNKKNNLFSFFKKKVNYEQEKNDFINRYIYKYLNFFKKQFFVLKLSKELIDELENSLWIALKNDLNKPIIVLDNIVEKIYTFILKLKSLEGQNSMNIFIEVVNTDFALYLKKQISILNSINEQEFIKEELEIDESTLSLLEKYKKELFKDENEKLE